MADSNAVVLWIRSHKGVFIHVLVLHRCIGTEWLHSTNRSLNISSSGCTLRCNFADHVFCLAKDGFTRARLSYTFILFINCILPMHFKEGADSLCVCLLFDCSSSLLERSSSSESTNSSGSAKNLWFRKLIAHLLRVSENFAFVVTLM